MTNAAAMVGLEIKKKRKSRIYNNEGSEEVWSDKLLPPLGEQMLSAVAAKICHPGCVAVVVEGQRSVERGATRENKQYGDYSIFGFFLVTGPCAPLPKFSFLPFTAASIPGLFPPFLPNFRSALSTQ